MQKRYIAYASIFLVSLIILIAECVHAKMMATLADGISKELYEERCAICHVDDTFNEEMHRYIITQGKKIYENHCLECHGEMLSGTRQLQKKSMQGVKNNPAPPLDGSDRYILHSNPLRIDLSRRTKPSNTPMPDYEDMIDGFSIKLVHAYILAFYPTVKPYNYTNIKDK